MYAKSKKKIIKVRFNAMNSIPQLQFTLDNMLQMCKTKLKKLILLQFLMIGFESFI